MTKTSQHWRKTSKLPGDGETFQAHGPGHLMLWKCWKQSTDSKQLRAISVISIKILATFFSDLEKTTWHSQGNTEVLNTQSIPMERGMLQVLQTWSQILSWSQSSKNSMVLAPKRTHRQMEQTRHPRNNQSANSWSTPQGCYPWLLAASLFAAWSGLNDGGLSTIPSSKLKICCQSFFP